MTVMLFSALALAIVAAFASADRAEPRTDYYGRGDARRALQSLDECAPTDSELIMAIEVMVVNQNKLEGQAAQIACMVQCYNGERGCAD